MIMTDEDLSFALVQCERYNHEEQEYEVVTYRALMTGYEENMDWFLDTLPDDVIIKHVTHNCKGVISTEAAETTVDRFMDVYDEYIEGCM